MFLALRQADRSAALAEAAAEVAKLQKVNQEEHAQRFSAPKPLQEAMHQVCLPHTVKLLPRRLNIVSE